MIIMRNGFTAVKEYKRQLNDLMMHTFDFSFDRWHDLHVWNDHYECYSIIENDTMLANISVFRMNLITNGIKRDCIQLGAVATRAEYRGKGLARKLMEHILKLYPDMPIFLNANSTVLDFYPKFGFVPMTYKQSFTRCERLGGGEMLKLTVTDPKVEKYLAARTQYSNVFDCINAYSTHWFHLLYKHSDHIYELPQLNVMLVAEQHTTTLTIHDIITANPITFSQLIPHLNFSGVEMIEFGFNPDWLAINCLKKEYQVDDGSFFVRGDFGVDREYMIPELVIT